VVLKPSSAAYRLVPFTLSRTVWFAPVAPKGHESNWVQTMPGKSFFVIFRLYGPLETWFDRTWKPGDFELVK
jgi:hypothetical protein